MAMKTEIFRSYNVVLYDDGSIDRLPLPACDSSADSTPHHVATHDLPLNDAKGTFLRLFKPPPLHHLLHHKHPLLLYFHGGGFVFGSTCLAPDHSFLAKLASSASILIVSVEYRLAPEHPLPAAYDDGIEALLWLHRQLLLGEHAAHPWLSMYADFSKCFLGGDSAGANLAHHVAMWAATGLGFERRSTDLGSEGASWCTSVDVASSAPAMEGLCLQGVILIHPFFTCGAETFSFLEVSVWKLAGVGTDHPFANPLLSGAPSLANAALPRYLVLVASKDVFAPRGISFHKALVDAGKEAKLFTSLDEQHVFHINSPDSENVPAFLDELCGFLSTSTM